MQLRSLAFALVACAAAPAAAGPQSFRDGVQALCDLPDHVPDSGEPYDKRLVAVGAWADAHITNAEARKIGAFSKGLTKQALADAVKKAGITRCKLLDYDLALQSFEDAMKVVCAAPSDRAQIGAYMKSHLLNPEVIRMFTALGNADPAEQVRIVHAALERAHITSCATFDAAQKRATEHVPAVSGTGFVDLDATVPTIAVTPSTIAVEGRAVVTLASGEVPAAELEAGRGLTIVKLREFLHALAAAHPQQPHITLVVDANVPYATLLDVIFTAKQQGFTQPALAVHVGADTKAIPIELPPPQKPALGMFVSFDKDKLVVWSISGKEGTLHKPKATVGKAAELVPVLADIVARHWKTGARGDDDRAIVIVPQAKTTTGALADVLAQVRMTADGKELFPLARLSSGLE